MKPFLFLFISFGLTCIQVDHYVIPLFVFQYVGILEFFQPVYVVFYLILLIQILNIILILISKYQTKSSLTILFALYTVCLVLLNFELSYEYYLRTLFSIKTMIPYLLSLIIFCVYIFKNREKW
jgi:hypothetical protein